MQEFHNKLTLYRVVDTIGDKVVLEVRREGRVVSYAYGYIEKGAPVFDGKNYESAEAAKRAVIDAVPEREGDPATASAGTRKKGSSTRVPKRKP